MERVAIAVAGATGSGKTTLAEAIATMLDCAVIRTDDYYHPLDHLTFDERCLVNFDHPSAIDHVLLAEHVDSILHGDAVPAPRYDFTRHTRFLAPRVVEPREVLIVEGLFALCFPAVASRCQVRVFVDTPEDECLRRRLVRDVQERGRSPVEVIERFSNHVAPMFREHIAPTVSRATITVSGMDDVAHGADRVVEGARAALGTFVGR